MPKYIVQTDDVFRYIVIDDNGDEAETCGKKSVANFMLYFMLLGSKP
jgi:hypothetical protein